jgi:hypothetical protein
MRNVEPRGLENAEVRSFKFNKIRGSVLHRPPRSVTRREPPRVPARALALRSRDDRDCRDHELAASAWHARVRCAAPICARDGRDVPLIQVRRDPPRELSSTAFEWRSVTTNRRETLRALSHLPKDDRDHHERKRVACSSVARNVEPGALEAARFRSFYFNAIRRSVLHRRASKGDGSRRLDASIRVPSRHNRDDRDDRDDCERKRAAGTSTLRNVELSVRSRTRLSNNSSSMRNTTRSSRKSPARSCAERLREWIDTDIGFMLGMRTEPDSNPLRRDTRCSDTKHRDTKRRDTKHREVRRREIMRREVLRRETLRCETLRRGAKRHETRRDDAMRCEDEPQCSVRSGVHERTALNVRRTAIETRSP